MMRHRNRSMGIIIVWISTRSVIALTLEEDGELAGYHRQAVTVTTGY